MRLYLYFYIPIKNIVMIHKLFNSLERHVYLADNVGTLIIIGETNFTDGIYLFDGVNYTLLAVINSDGFISDLNAHKNNKGNPHSVNKYQIGLGNVTNESKSTMFTNPFFTGRATVELAPTNSNHVVRKLELDNKQGQFGIPVYLNYYQTDTPETTEPTTLWYNPTTDLVKEYDTMMGWRIIHGSQIYFFGDLMYIYEGDLSTNRMRLAGMAPKSDLTETLMNLSRAIENIPTVYSPIFQNQLTVRLGNVDLLDVRRATPTSSGGLLTVSRIESDFITSEAFFVGNKPVATKEYVDSKILTPLKTMKLKLTFTSGNLSVSIISNNIGEITDVRSAAPGRISIFMSNDVADSSANSILINNNMPRYSETSSQNYTIRLLPDVSVPCIFELEVLNSSRIATSAIAIVDEYIEIIHLSDGATPPPPEPMP